MKISNWLCAMVIASALGMGGCASLPSPEVMKAEATGYQLPKLPTSDKAMIYVVRPSSLGPLVRFNVFVDDKEPSSEVGFTRAGEYIYFNVAPGEHKIFSKAENWAEMNVSAKPGDVVFLQQETSMGFLMARNNLSKIEEYQGKYHLKTLKAGTILKAEK